MTNVFNGIEFNERHYDERLRTIIEYYGSKDDEIDRRDPKYTGYGDVTFRYNFHSFRDVLPYLANSVMDNFGLP